MVVVDFVSVFKYNIGIQSLFYFLRSGLNGASRECICRNVLGALLSFPLWAAFFYFEVSFIGVIAYSLLK